MNKRFCYTITGLTAMLIFSCAVTFNGYAQESAQRWQKDKSEKAEDLSKLLNLTPEQKEKIEKQRSINRGRIAGIRDKLRTAMLELKNELDKPQVNKERVNAIMAEIKTLSGEQLEQRVNGIIFMKQILTPEQFKKLQEGRGGFGKYEHH